MNQHECPACGDTFDSRRGLGVHHSRVHDERLPNRECSLCGTEFYSDYEKKYCSENCLRESDSYAGENHPNWDGGKERTECELCGATFEYYPSEKPGHYCPDCVESENWRYEPDNSGANSSLCDGGKEEYTCEYCDTDFEKHPSEVKGERVFCSRNCQYEWLSEAFTGEGHPNWAGGGMPNYRGDWRAVRQQALERDGHACVVCGTDREELGQNPDVHHIVPVRAFAGTEDRDREDAHTPDNVVCLCQSCHRRAEFGGIERAELRCRAGIDADA